MIDGVQTQTLAALQLKLSTRQIKRLCKAVRAGCAGALISKRRGQPSNQRTPAKRKHDIVALLKAQYSDFGPLLASEYLAKHHNETLSAETLRQWMIQEGLWKAQVKRKVHQHPSRALGASAQARWVKLTAATMIGLKGAMQPSRAAA